MSLFFTFFDLYYLLLDRTMRRALHNHVIIVLLMVGLIYESINIPWILYNDFNRSPLIESELFYSVWTFFNYSFYALQVELFAWATIERHLLIFHDRWIRTSRQRILFHYLPVVVIIIYYLIYFSLVHFAPFCKSSFEGFLAGGIHIPCVFDRTTLGMWDLIFHQVCPTLIIVFVSLALLIRSIYQKSRLQQGMQWRKHRKMIIQLLSISTIYIVFNGPWVLVIFSYQYGLPESIANHALVYTGFLYYYVIFCFPLVCLLSLPELRNKFQWKKIFNFHQQTGTNLTVQSLTNPMN